MAVRLSLRPDLDQNVDGLPIYVTGLLPDTAPLVAYEERLQIHNAVGRCTVQVVDGSDPLPPGSSVYVDHTTQEVVVAWPAYSQYVTPLANPGFETGDTSGWSFTPRGGGGVPVVDSAYRYEGAHSLRWPGGRGMGSEGGIEVEAWNNAIAPCLPGRRVTIHTRCMYNPAGHHFGSRYQGLIRFLDSMGNPIGPPARGKQYKGRGNNGRWNDVSATAVGPAGTAGVQLGAWLTASEAPVWLDAASWDVPSSVGINADATLNVTLRVRDSSGRTAMWAGQIVVSEQWGKYPAWLVYRANSPNVLIYANADFSSPPVVSDINDGYSRKGALSFPRGILIIYSPSVVTNVIVRDGDVAGWEGFGAGVHANKVAYFGDVMLIAQDSNTAYQHSLDDGRTRTSYPGETAKAFLSCAEFAVKFPYSVAAPEVSFSFPLVWQSFGASASGAIQCGASDYEGSRVAWVTNESPSSSVVYIRSTTSVTSITVPSASGTPVMARCASGWLIAFEGDGLWLVDDASSFRRVFSGNVAWVASKDGASVLISDGVMYASFDDGERWVIEDSLDYPPVFAVPLWATP